MPADSVGRNRRLVGRLTRADSGYAVRVRTTTGTSKSPPAQRVREPERFEFRYSGAVGMTARAVTATRARSYVEVSADAVTVHFGPWTMSSPRSNVAEIVESGPYAPWKVIGSPRLSFADRGITFATNSDRGVCIRFFDPIPGIEPTGRFRHPGVTVTVADPDGLVAALGAF
jgi:hypothetical protein